MKCIECIYCTRRGFWDVPYWICEKHEPGETPMVLSWDPNTDGDCGDYIEVEE